MSDNPDPQTPTVDNAPVTVTTIHKLCKQYPAWRKTSHTTDAGREVWMVEFADDEYEFTDGLPGEFVEMVSKTEGER